MVNTDILTSYYGGVIGFTKDTRVAVADGGASKLYCKGDEAHITPAVLYMVASGKLPLDSFKLVLRKLEQLEDEEVVELSRLVLPAHNKQILGQRRTVSRQGERRAFTLEVSITANEALGRETSLVINTACDVAISDIVYPPFGGKPIVTQLAAPNQVKAVRWLLSKHIDVFGLLPKGLASGRKRWTKHGYETPGSPRFNQN